MSIKVTWTHVTYKKNVKTKTETQNITPMVSSLSWSGASTQASRQVSFSIANNPYDKNMNIPRICPGDVIKLYKDGEKSPRFIGRVPNRQMTSDIGTIEIIAYDYMHDMLSSTITKKFKNKTPEYITKAICKDCGITPGKIVKTKTKIKKYFPDNASPYNIIIGAYRKVRSKTKKEYFMRMNGTKLDVIEKGEKTKTILEEKVNLTKANYEEDADGVVNKVVVFRKNKQVGSYKKADSILKYGVKQQVISVDKGKGKKEANNTMKGVSKTASVSVIGNWECIAGRGVYIKDTASGLTGWYWIKNDTHKFENGIHTMDLDLEFKNVTENPSVQQMSTSLKKTSSSSTTTYKYVKKNATFTAYYPGENGEWLDSHDRRLVASKMTCAAARSIAFNTKIIVKGTGTSYDGKTYKVTDRPKHDILKGRLHIDLLLNNRAECNSFGTRAGKIWIKKKVRTSKKDSKSNSKADKVISIAKSYQGKVRYVFGSRNLDGGTSDCSGFTQAVFRKIGINIGNDTIEQSHAGKGVSKSKAKKGDIVIFQGTYRAGPSHVGIMVSKNKFIHCSSSAKTVVISTLSGYYTQHFHSMRRVL